MTPEERQQRAEERKKRHEEWKRQEAEDSKKFPGFQLIYRGRTNGDGESDVAVWVMLRDGDRNCLRISWREDLENDKEVDIILDDTIHLARFIRALTCRYNAMVEEANGYAEQSKMKPLVTIDAE